MESSRKFKMLVLDYGGQNLDHYISKIWGACAKTMVMAKHKVDTFHIQNTRKKREKGSSLIGLCL